MVRSLTHYCGIFVKTDNVDYTCSWEEDHTRVNESNKWATTAAKDYPRVAGGLWQERGYHRIFFTFLRRNHFWSYMSWIVSVQNVEIGHFHHLIPYDFSTLFSDLCRNNLTGSQEFPKPDLILTAHSRYIKWLVWCDKKFNHLVIITEMWTQLFFRLI